MCKLLIFVQRFFEWFSARNIGEAAPVLTFILLLLIPVTVQAGSLELGFNSSSSSGLEKLSTVFEYSKKENLCEIAIDGALAQERAGDRLVSSTIKTDLQANYYFEPKWIAFLGIGYARDTGQGITDQTDIGAGAGYREEIWHLQSGIYAKSTAMAGIDENSREWISRTTYGFQWPIYGPLSMREEATAEISLSRLGAEDYRLGADTALIAEIDEQIYVSAGLDFGYDHVPVPGFTRCSRDWMARVGVKF